MSVIDRCLDSLSAVDAEAERVRAERGWNLAAFVAAFTPGLEDVLVVQLGDYARTRYGGHPWTLPGGSVEVGEAPSAAIRRELAEEAHVAAPAADLRLAGWFPRPNHKPHHRPLMGELLLLYAATVPVDADPRPHPPETLAARLVRFDIADWLAVPDSGEGTHPLQPLPRHWVYWAHLARVALRDPSRAPVLWSYDSPEALRQPPWPVADEPLA